MAIINMVPANSQVEESSVHRSMGNMTTATYTGQKARALAAMRINTAACVGRENSRGLMALFTRYRSRVARAPFNPSAASTQNWRVSKARTRDPMGGASDAVAACGNGAVKSAIPVQKERCPLALAARRRRQQARRCGGRKQKPEPFRWSVIAPDWSFFTRIAPL
eukprot:scaffold1770_cov129-Isochrysis_galbana.AAC.2